jgi:hypothetical protein
MTLYGDYVSIAGTTAGVTGTVSLPVGARILGLNLSMKTADGGIVTCIELLGTGLPTPLKITPKMVFSTIGTNMYGMAIAPSPLIDLQKFGLSMKTGTLTIKVTTTATETVAIGVMWVA